MSLLPIAEQMRDEVRRDTGLDCSIGIGPNRMIAKLASDAAKPRGLMEVRAGWEEGFLAGLPLKAMPGVGPKTAARWVELGLADVWQVQQMEEPALERLIGPEARALKRRVHGYGGTTLQGDRLPRSVSRETTLSRDLRDPATLEATLSLLTARVAGQLRDEHLVARTVTLKLRHDDFYTVTRRHTLEVATDLDGELYAAARDLFRTAFADVRGRDRGVRLIGISATNLGVAAEADLFEPPERRRLRDLSVAVDQLRDKFGFSAVTPGSALGSSAACARRSNLHRAFHRPAVRERAGPCPRTAGQPSRPPVSPAAPGRGTPPSPRPARGRARCCSDTAGNTR